MTNKSIVSLLEPFELPMFSDRTFEVESYSIEGEFEAQILLTEAGFYGNEDIFVDLTLNDAKKMIQFLQESITEFERLSNLPSSQ